MSLSFVPVKEEYEGASGAGDLAELYLGHVVKEELVLGPEVLQPTEVSFVLRSRFKAGKDMSAVCGADVCGVPMEPHASETQYHCQTGIGPETVLHPRHRIKKEPLCEPREPPMVQIPSPCFFDDLNVKREAATESSRPSQAELEKPLKKPWPQHSIKPCYIPLMRIDKHKTKDRINNNTQKTIGKPKKFLCDYCGKGFSMKQTLLVHIRTHTGEKPFGCKVCMKVFSDSAILIRHRRIHTGEKPHICDVCQKRFSERYLLRYHKRVHSGGAPYACKHCFKTYNHISNMKRHERTHDKPFPCDVCDARFNLRTKLETHLRTHLKRKPFSCGACRKAFSVKSHLNRHLKIHCDKKDYCCRVCKAVFTQHASLKKHVKRKGCGEL